MNVFITGGTSGIGLALTKLYLKEGHYVGTCSRDISKFPKDIKEHKSLCLYKVDVLDSEKLKEALNDFSSKGGLDLVIANAGRSVGKKSKMPDFKIARGVIEVNLFGVLNTYEHALELMLPSGRGHLAAVSSVAGFMGLPGASSYSSSKSAVTIFNESLCLDLKDKGIKVSTICPGFIETPLTQKNDHQMPFLMSAEKAALRIKKSLDNKEELIIFPWQMKLAITFLSKIPRSWYRKLMAFKLFNYSSH